MLFVCFLFSKDALIKSASKDFHFVPVYILKLFLKEHVALKTGVRATINSALPSQE